VAVIVAAEFDDNDIVLVLCEDAPFLPRGKSAARGKGKVETETSCVVWVEH